MRPECKIISAPALREIYTNLIEKVKFWKNQGAKTLYFITNVKLDTSEVIMASSMVSGNHWSCVHINLETGDGIYADSIGREVPCLYCVSSSKCLQTSQHDDHVKNSHVKLYKKVAPRSLPVIL